MILKYNKSISRYLKFQKSYNLNKLISKKRMDMNIMLVESLYIITHDEIMSSIGVAYN